MLNELNRKLRELWEGTEGFALALTLLVWPLMLVMVSGLFVTGETIRQKGILQRAVDASSYAGAQVQADTMSRISVLNRMMAWTYIQANKMEMDYTVREWSKLSNDVMTAVKVPLSETNSALSETCPDMIHKQERGNLSASDWGWYAGYHSGSGYLPRTIALNGHEETQETISGVSAVTAGLGSSLGDAYENIRSMNGAIEDLMSNSRSRIETVVQRVFEENSRDLVAGGKTPVPWIQAASLQDGMELVADEDEFMKLAADRYEDLHLSSGFNSWWNLESGAEGFRREYSENGGALKSVFDIGVKGWIWNSTEGCRNYVTGESTVEIRGDGSVTLPAFSFVGTPVDVSAVTNAVSGFSRSGLGYNAGSDRVYAKPRLAGENYIRKGSVIVGAKYPMSNPLEAIFGNLTGSWYDAHTVTGRDIWCVGAARACAKHPEKAGYSRTELSSYRSNPSDYAAVMLPLSLADEDAAAVLKKVYDGLNIQGWEVLSDWSMINQFAGK